MLPSKIKCCNQENSSKLFVPSQAEYDSNIQQVYWTLMSTLTFSYLQYLVPQSNLKNLNQSIPYHFLFAPT